VFEFEKMTDIPAKSRKILAENFSQNPLVVPVTVTKAGDRTKKILWSLSDSQKIESVLIPEKDHITLCLSTQVGCRMGCRFCRTGSLGFSRNLTAGEILAQIIEARKLLEPGENLTNLVFMGMGEPLDNLQNTMKSLTVITSPDYQAFSVRHISLSTVGLPLGINQLATESKNKSGVGLTISLSAAQDSLRNSLMPINLKFPLKQLKKSLLDFPLNKGRRITIAYVLIKGVNDGKKQALELASFLRDLKVKINLIPFNPWPGAPFLKPEEETVENFKKFLTDLNFNVMIRHSKGLDVNAACGQLAADRNSQPQK
jgi:23S rRNA (adenine2503-C2)-methyltransferase